MTLDPHLIPNDLDLLERIEKATLRLVVQAIDNFRRDIAEIFVYEKDFAQDIGEDLTREALDRMGTSIIPVRLFGKMDYKRARYLFLPEFAVRQALFVDSKAEKRSVVARIQTDQTSMTIRQIRGGKEVVEPGGLPVIIPHTQGDLLTTTIFVKYNYDEDKDKTTKILKSIAAIALPNGLLQDRYNPNANDAIWNAGPNAPSRGEEFRTRISFAKLRSKATWRVQALEADPTIPHRWVD